MKEKKPRILVVDDSVINLTTVEQKLKDLYEIIPINSGTRAISFLRNDRPDLILLDIGMADKDGIETLKEIRALPGGDKLPVIMLTARGDRDSIMKTQKLGINDYVLKPFETQELRYRIKKVLNGPPPENDDDDEYEDNYF